MISRNLPGYQELTTHYAESGKKFDFKSILRENSRETHTHTHTQTQNRI